MGNWIGDESDPWNQLNEPDDSYGLDDVIGWEESQDAKSHAGPDGALGLDDVFAPENEQLDRATDMGADEAVDAGLDATINIAENAVPSPDDYAPGWLQWLSSRPKWLISVVVGLFVLMQLGPVLELAANATE